MTFNHVGMEIGFLSNIFHIFILRFSKSIMLNTNFDEKVDIVKGDLEEILEKTSKSSSTICQLLEPFHQTCCQLCLNRVSSLSSTSLFFDLAEETLFFHLVEFFPFKFE